MYTRIVVYMCQCVWGKDTDDGYFSNFEFKYSPPRMHRDSSM